MHIPHELQEEFSAEVDLIERLRRTSYEFGRLASDYDDVNRSIHLVESEQEPTEDAALEELKRRRLRLKDEIAAFLLRTERRM